VTLFPLIAWILNQYATPPQMLALLVASSLLIVVKHHANIRRLLAHTEPRFRWSRG